MLHIGETQVNLGMPNAKVLYFGETKMGPIIPDGDDGSVKPIPGRRLGNVATIVGEYIDNENKRYALAVCDGKYLRTNYRWQIGSDYVDTPLPNYNNNTAVLGDKHTGTYNTNLVLASGSIYSAFSGARSACSITINGVLYRSCLPNVSELAMICEKKDLIIATDPTIQDYPNMANALNRGRVWASNEYKSGLGWCYRFSPSEQGPYSYNKTSQLYVMPVFEIPLD